MDAIENKDLEPHKHHFQNRANQALEPFHYLANMMHPKYMGKRLTDDQEKMAEDWILNVNPEFLPLVMSFKIKDEKIYSSYMLTDTMISNFQASKWWLIAQKNTEKSKKLSMEFCQLMRGLQAAPTSSASLERIFSTFGHVWSKLSNKLNPQTADKLVKVYRYLCAMSPIGRLLEPNYKISCATVVTC